MQRDLISITDDEIECSAENAVNSIVNGEFVVQDKCDYYSDKIAKIVKEIKLHHAENSKLSDECKYGMHKTFLFINDMTSSYANCAEYRVFYKCACLDCGLIDDYQMSPLDCRRTVKIPVEGNNLKIFAEFDNVRRRYLELQEAGIEIEEIVEIINNEYREKDVSQKRQLSMIKE